MKILLISYHYKDLTVPRSRKWQLIYKGLVEQVGSEVRVLSGDLVNTQSTNEYRSQETIFKLLFRPLVQKLRWPDYATIWLFKQIGMALISKRQVGLTHLITVSHPFSSHIIGLIYKLKYPDIQWTVEIGDPFELEADIRLNSTFYKYINRYFENLILNKSTIVTVNSKILADSYTHRYDLEASKVRVVPPVFDGDISKYKSPTGSKFAYAGRFYNKVRPFEILIDFALLLNKRMPDASIDVYGPKTEHYENLIKLNNLEQVILLKGVVCGERVNSILKDYDYVLNFANHNTIQVPSKLIEISSLGRPVLNIVKSELPGASSLSDNIYNISEIDELSLNSALEYFYKLSKSDVALNSKLSEYSYKNQVYNYV